MGRDRVRLRSVLAYCGIASALEFEHEYDI